MLSSIYMGLPWWLSGKGSICNAGHPGSIPGSGRSPGGGNGNPLQYSCLENPLDRGARWARVHGVSESDMTEATEHACAECVRVNPHLSVHPDPLSPRGVHTFVLSVVYQHVYVESGKMVQGTDPICKAEISSGLWLRGLPGLSPSL